MYDHYDENGFRSKRLQLNGGLSLERNTSFRDSLQPSIERPDYTDIPVPQRIAPRFHGSNDSTNVATPQSMTFPQYPSPGMNTTSPHPLTPIQDFLHAGTAESTEYDPINQDGSHKSLSTYRPASVGTIEYQGTCCIVGYWKAMTYWNTDRSNATTTETTGLNRANPPPSRCSASLMPSIREDQPSSLCTDPALQHDDSEVSLRTNEMPPIEDAQLTEDGMAQAETAISDISAQLEQLHMDVNRLSHQRTESWNKFSGQLEDLHKDIKSLNQRRDELRKDLAKSKGEPVPSPRVDSGYFSITSKRRCSEISTSFEQVLQ